MAHHLLAQRFGMSFINKCWINHTLKANRSKMRERTIEREHDAERKCLRQPNRGKCVCALMRVSQVFIISIGLSAFSRVWFEFDFMASIKLMIWRECCGNRINHNVQNRSIGHPKSIAQNIPSHRPSSDECRRFEFRKPEMTQWKMDLSMVTRCWSLDFGSISEQYNGSTATVDVVVVVVLCYSDSKLLRTSQLFNIHIVKINWRHKLYTIHAYLCNFSFFHVYHRHNLLLLHHRHFFFEEHFPLSLLVRSFGDMDIVSREVNPVWHPKARKMIPIRMSCCDIEPCHFSRDYISSE